MNDHTREMIEENELNGYAKIDQYNPVVVGRIADRYRAVLQELGEDPDREGLLKTPERAAKALQFLTHGVRRVRRRSRTAPGAARRRNRLNRCAQVSWRRSRDYTPLLTACTCAG